MATDQGYSSGWFPDPSGRYQLRYFGTSWTDQVCSEGVVMTSPLNQPDAAVRPGRATGAVLALIGGVVMAVGALLPWETVSASSSYYTGTLASVNGTAEGAGPVVLVVGLIVALLAVLVLTATIGRRRAGIATVLVAVTSLIFAFGNYSGISKDIDSAPAGVDANLGIGLILVVIAGILVVIAGIGLIRNKRRAT